MISRSPRRTSVIGRRTSVIGRRTSVIGRRTSVTGRRTSVVGRRLSVTGRRVSVTGRLRSVTHRLCSTSLETASLGNAARRGGVQRQMLARPLAALALLLAAGCSPRAGESPPGSPSPGETSPEASVEAPAPAARRRAPVREGGALARGVSEQVLYLADEDHGVLRRIPLPVDVNTPPSEVRMPGPPAQVLALDGLVLATVRDPGLLVISRPDRDAGLVEIARVPLPADAWGIAVTPDEKTALVSSPWSHRVSVVDLETARLRVSLDVAREPRAIAVRPDGRGAYVTHLPSAAITRIDGLDAQPSAKPIALRPAPASAPVQGKGEAFQPGASLAYAAALSPSGDRLFVPRHALGAFGQWFGRSTVDVLVTSGDTTLAPDRTSMGTSVDVGSNCGSSVDADGHVPLRSSPFVQPRAVAYRHATSTLLVASEGNDRLAELDARAIDPSLAALRTYDLGSPSADVAIGKTRCGAPAGIALSADEALAYVFCRSTGDLAIVTLDAFDGSYRASPIPIVHLADDPLPEQAALGRRLFHDATDWVMSGGLACAGCHPEGRDDGHVWQEHEVESAPGAAGALTGGPTVTQFSFISPNAFKIYRGHPRQTPMLAGRVAARGPYGWHGQSQTLEDRIVAGFGMHRWRGNGEAALFSSPRGRAQALAAFLREGLAPPPRERRAFELHRFLSCYKGGGWLDASVVLTEQWPEGDPEPTVTVN
jgi:DNA-binding beta-propeller fold protein YncE